MRKPIFVSKYLRKKCGGGKSIEEKIKQNYYYKVINPNFEDQKYVSF